MKTVLVLGSSGFIGGHLVKRLKKEGYFVVGADIQQPKYEKPDRFFQFDLRNPVLVSRLFLPNNFLEQYSKIDEVYQLAADMGGAGYIFTGENDAHIMHNSAMINLNVVECCRIHKVEKVFYSSSACMYPQELQNNYISGNSRTDYSLKEHYAYPANPDSEYGWEKLFSERLYLAYARNHGLNVRIARFHNIFGPEGTWKGGKEKAPAAICRKVAESNDGSIEIWGDGSQTRSFLYVDECIEAVMRLMESDFRGPVNIGSDEMVSISDLVAMVAEIADKLPLYVKCAPGPVGVRGRNSNNDLIFEKLGWKPTLPLVYGLEKTYHWINQQIEKEKSPFGTGGHSFTESYDGI
jgi:GDP-D-mannose 3',5'-epimerase